VTILELKKHIYENNKVEYILEQIGCHHIKYHNRGYYTCANIPNQDGDGDNKTAVNIRNDEGLSCRNYTRNIGVPADIITLVGYNKGINIRESLKYLHKLLGLKYEYNSSVKRKEENKTDPLEIFKKVRRKRNYVNVNDIEVFDNTIIEEYDPTLHIDWVKEGITEFTRKRFNIGYSYKYKRIVVPVRYWAGDEGDYVGIIGRTTVPSFQILDIPKYYPLIPFQKSGNIYGLQENWEEIQEANMVVLAESEKSVLKRHSRLDGTVVALGSHSLSSEQIMILIGLNVEIVIAMDQGIDINHIRSMCENFYKIRRVSYVFDSWGLLKEKEAPMDLLDKYYKFMLKHRVTYDEKEHKEYLKELDNAKNK